MESCARNFYDVKYGEGEFTGTELLGENSKVNVNSYLDPTVRKELGTVFNTP